MYQQDSFFDLSPLGRVGLVCISTTLFLVVLAAAFFLLRNRQVWARFTGALVLFWLFVWVSPQIYYQYYRLLIEDLPLQWVIWPPRPPSEALSLLFFQGPHNMSAHSQGGLGWSLILVQLLNGSLRSTPVSRG